MMNGFKRFAIKISFDCNEIGNILIILEYNILPAVASNLNNPFYWRYVEYKVNTH